MSYQPPVPAKPPLHEPLRPPTSAQDRFLDRPNGLGVAALVIGIVAIILAIIPFVGVLAFLLAPIAVILGIIGIFRKSRRRGTALAGLILGAIAIILAGIVTSAMASSGRSATDGPGPSVAPAVGSSAMATDNPDATKSERGNIIRTVGQGAGLSDKSGKQAVSFIVNRIAIDPVCTGKYPRPAENGHYLALNISVQTYAPLKEVFGSGTFPIGAHNWKLIAANGTTFNGRISSGPALGCLADAEELPDRVGTGEKVTGTLILDVPTTEGTLVFDPTFADASWEWQYPVK